MDSTIDISVTVLDAKEAQSIQEVAELAMGGVEGFYNSTKRPKSDAAIKILNILEALRDGAECIETRLYED
jgi:hypothetical protein